MITNMQKEIIKTPVGDLVPFYEISDGRQKNRPSVEYFKGGALYSIYLQEQTEIQTPLGKVPAELITFYESGAIKRIFPLYGQLSGFWTEDQEYELATDIEFNLQGEMKKVKPMCLYFYESGQLASITIWPKERLTVHTPYGDITTDLGVEFYESGEIKSVEPVLGSILRLPKSEKFRVEPLIQSSDGVTNWNDGVLYPYYSMAFRMHANDNSLKFEKDGRIAGIRTVPLYKYKKYVEKTRIAI